MNRSDARTRLFATLDSLDQNGQPSDRFSVSEANQKLAVAQEILVKRCASEGGAGLDELITVTVTDGYCDLSAYKPLIVDSVSYASGTDTTAYFADIPALATSQFRQRVSGTNTLQVRLVRRPTMPTDDTTQIGYGPGLQSEILDELLVLYAARLLSTKEPDLYQSIEQLFSELMRTQLQDDQVVKVFDLPGPQTNYQNYYGYIYQPHYLLIGTKGY